MPDVTQTMVTREIFGNVSVTMATWFYVFVSLACLYAAFGFAKRIRARRQARLEPETAPAYRGFAAKILAVIAYLTFHKQLRRDRYAGTAHMLMFYGFFILFIGTCLVAAEDYGSKIFGKKPWFFYGTFYQASSLIIDLGGVAFIAGLVMFIRRRSSAAPDAARILREWWVGSLSWLLLLIAISGFLLEGFRIARDLPDFERWSIVGYGIACILRATGFSGDASLSWHRALWAAHAVLCIAFFALLPWRFFGHMVHGAVSWSRRTSRPIAQLRPVDLSAQNPGAEKVTDLNWKDLLQVDACTTCGRCNAVCPAAASGKPLRPREVMLNLRQSMDGLSHSPLQRGDPLVPLIAEDVIWSCTTCGACNEACPVGIEVFEKIIDLRRGRVEAGEVPESASQVFEATSARNNPFGKPDSERMNWAAGLTVPVAAADEEIELLYWIGCAGSFDPDGQRIARSVIKILNHLKVNFRVLGKRERCTGDPVRRMGEEGLFQEMAKSNIQTMKLNNVKRVLTHCPHCFNAFKNEYLSLGGSYEVEHHSQFLARMIKEGKLKLTGGGAETMTFHDPCYLGRGNNEIAAPREVLMSLPQVKMVEMKRSGRESFCCGAGGGAMWLDVKGNTRVENLRAAEAAETGAGAVATACPFCKSMLGSAVQNAGNAMKVKDLAEWVIESEGL